jgi:hypothetical protein
MMASFTLSGEIGGLSIDITLTHEDSVRLRSGVVRFTRQITNEMFTFALEEKKRVEEQKRLAARGARPVQMNRLKETAKQDPLPPGLVDGLDDGSDDDEDEEDDF